MSDETVTATVGCDWGFIPGEIVQLQGLINDQCNLQMEICSVAACTLILRQPSMWTFMLDHVRMAWFDLRHWIKRARWELEDLWYEAKDDFKRTLRAGK